MHLFYLFAYTFFLAILLPVLFPFWHMLYFAPFIVLSYYRCSLSGCLWWSLICGFVVDLFSADVHIGNFAINYCLATFCLHRFQLHFFEDRLSTLPVMTFGFTSLSALIQVLFFSLINRPFALTWHWFFNDLLLIPLQAAIYAIFAFTLPSLMIRSFKRRYLLFRLSRR